MSATNRNSLFRILVYGYPPKQQWTTRKDVSVTYAVSVQTLQQKLLQRPTDLVIVHHNPPQTGGLSAVKTVRQYISDVPIALAGTGLSRQIRIKASSACVTWCAELDGTHSPAEELFSFVTDAGNWLAESRC